MKSYRIPKNPTKSQQIPFNPHYTSLIHHFESHEISLNPMVSPSLRPQAQTVFICFLLGFGAMTFSQDANRRGLHSDFPYGDMGVSIAMGVPQ